MKTPYFLISSVLLLTACSSTPDSVTGKALDYQSAQKPNKTLETPPDLVAPRLNDAYNLPQRGSVLASDLNKTNTPQKADSTQVLAPVDNMKIEREGSQRWLLVQKSPDELWSILEEFWQDNGFVLLQNAPRLGILETDWAENRAKLPQDGVRSLLSKVGLDGLYSTPERDKFRTRIEKSARGTEIYITHRGMMEIYAQEGKSQTVWQPRPNDPELEAEFLGRLMLRLGATEERAKAALAAEQQAKTPASSRAEIVGNRLILRDDFDRAWRRVGLALDRVGLAVADRNRAQGDYYVRPVAQDPHMAQSTSIFAKLAFWRDDPKTKLDEELKAALRLNLSATNGGVALSLSEIDGSELKQDRQQAWLRALQQELR